MLAVLMIQGSVTIVLVGFLIFLANDDRKNRKMREQEEE